MFRLKYECKAECILLYMVSFSGIKSILAIVDNSLLFCATWQRSIYLLSDVLQMMGRAGRPQYDDHGVAVILVHDTKKHFYKKFLYEPFPVESRFAIC